MNVKLSNVRFSYLNVFVPRVNKGQPETDENGKDKRKFSSALIFSTDSPDAKAMETAIEQVAKEKWGEKATGILKKLYSTGKVCLKEGSTRIGEDGEIADGYEGMLFVNASASADKPPAVFNKFGQKITDATRGAFSGESRPPFSGDYGQAMIQIWAQDNQFGQRINATLLGVALSKFGEPLGRRELSDDDIAQEFDFEQAPDSLGEMMGE